MDSEAIKEQLVNAFSDVKLGTGIGLWQAQAIDDRESKHVQKKKRLNDEKNNWKSFSCEELQRCSSSLSFFDSNGMRLHLPAFILAEIEGGVDAGIVFHLTQLD